MISAPANPTSALYQKPAKFVVLLGPEDGSAPQPEYPPEEEGGDPLPGDECTWLIPLQATRSAGGGRDDLLTFDVDLDRADKRLIDTTTPTGVQRQIELRMLDEDGEPTQLIGWGFLSANPQRIGPDGESTAYEARITKHHFGVPLTSYPIYDPFVNRLDVNRPLVFNPEIDEIIEGNKSSRTAAQGWNYVIDPESVRTAAARTLQAQTASQWTLADAVLALCWWLNPEQEWISNPRRKTVDAAFTDRNDMLKNVAIPFGCYLPQALDTLLMPFEYGWYLTHAFAEGFGAQERVTSIRFFRRGSGTKKQLKLQRPGTSRDIKKTNVESLALEYSINDLANKVEVYGDYTKREATFDLYMGWSDSFDTTNYEDLEKGQTFAEAHPAVGRKFILNEGGDHNGVRPEITDPYDLEPLLGEEHQVRRRKFLRCLTQRPDVDDVESNGFLVQWYDENADGATDPDVVDDPGWTRVKWPFSILEKECGIWFEGPRPPSELWDLVSSGNADKVRVRITAVIAGDLRLTGTATRRDQSPNGQDVTLALDLRDRFQNSAVDAESVYHERESTARDDATEIQTYAEDIRDIEDAMRIPCSVTLEGVKHPEYLMGDLIDQVDGRNLSLNGYDPNAGADTRNPQIVGFTYHLNGGQRLELLLDSFKKQRPQILTSTLKGQQGKPVP